MLINLRRINNYSHYVKLEILLLVCAVSGRIRIGYFWNTTPYQYRRTTAIYGTVKAICLFYRMATERDLEKSEWMQLSNIIFDASGYFVAYATVVGVKLLNLVTGVCVATLARTENLRPLHVALYQVRHEVKAAILVL